METETIFLLSVFCHVIIVGFIAFIDIIMLKEMVDHWDPTKECNSIAA